MRRNFHLIFASLLVVVFSGCGHQKTNDHVQELIEVQLDVPQTAAVSEKVKVQAVVTQGNEQVDDADEVIFEVWKEGEEDDSKMIDVQGQDHGTYYTELSFKEYGLHYIQVHVTARGMHVMPKKEIRIE